MDPLLIYLHSPSTEVRNRSQRRQRDPTKQITKNLQSHKPQKKLTLDFFRHSKSQGGSYTKLRVTKSRQIPQVYTTTQNTKKKQLELGHCRTFPQETDLPITTTFTSYSCSTLITNFPQFPRPHLEPRLRLKPSTN